MNKVIAIDGPAGAGKSTVAQMVAAKLGYTYIDTGAMYRAVAVKALEKCNGEVLTDEFITQIVRDIDVNLQYVDNITKVFVDGVDITDKLRTPQINRIVSQVARLSTVREKMVFLQRKMALKGAIVMDGRDIASHVLPHADVKIYLTASVDERARRRFAQLKGKGYPIEIEKLQDEIMARDEADMKREISPLIKTNDAILLDTTTMTIQQVVTKILSLVKNDK